jgi:hypothetical protein
MPEPFAWNVRSAAPAGMDGARAGSATAVDTITLNVRMCGTFVSMSHRRNTSDFARVDVGPGADGDLSGTITWACLRNVLALVTRM